MRETLSITEEMVIQIHNRLIADTGGEFGVRDEATLFFITDEINREADTFRKAAIALRLTERHPFWDGQKRTAYLLAQMILKNDGYDLSIETDEIIGVLIKIAKYQCPEDEGINIISRWVKKKATRL